MRHSSKGKQRKRVFGVRRVAFAGEKSGSDLGPSLTFCKRGCAGPAYQTLQGAFAPVGASPVVRHWEWAKAWVKPLLSPSDWDGMSAGRKFNPIKMVPLRFSNAVLCGHPASNVPFP